MLNIILCGAPGSGKGTQSEFIVANYGLEHLSTGDLLRHEIASQSPLGQKVDNIISKGQLVPDDIMMELIGNYIDNLPTTAKGVIFDGFPRTVNQAEQLDLLLEHKHQEAHVIDLFVEEDELIERLLNRGKTSGRADDNLETIQKRLEVFHQQTKPVCAYYSEKGKYHAVEGMGTIEDISHRINDIIAAL